MKKKKRKKIKKLRKLKRITDEIWSYFSEWVRIRDKFTCFTCDKVEKPGQAGHRYHGKLDFDPINVNCQCMGCNHYKSGNLGEYERRLVKKYGQDVADDLKFRSNQIWKPSREELANLLEYWKNQLNDIKYGENK